LAVKDLTDAAREGSAMDGPDTPDARYMRGSAHKGGGASGCGCIATGFTLIFTCGLVLFIIYALAGLAAGDPDDPNHGRQVLSEMFGRFAVGTASAIAGLLLGVIALVIGICSGRPRRRAERIA
jgi:hypothetical protein